MKMVLPNYDDCITNVACSVLKYFGQDYTHKTIKDIDEVLEREHYCINNRNAKWT